MWTYFINLQCPCNNKPNLNYLLSEDLIFALALELSLKTHILLICFFQFFRRVRLLGSLLWFSSERVNSFTFLPLRFSFIPQIFQRTIHLCTKFEGPKCWHKGMLYSNQLQLFSKNRKTRCQRQPWVEVWHLFQRLWYNACHKV